MKTRGRRSLIAWVCVITMLLGCFSGLNFVSIKSEASETGYTELTFNDFGLSDQDVTGTVMNTMTPMSTWDNTVFQGKITFPATDWQTSQCENQTVTVGCDGDGSGGVTFRVANGQNFAFFANGMTVTNNASGNTNGWGILDRTAIGYPNADDDGNQTSVEQDELTYRITAETLDGGESQKITIEITSAYGTGSYWFEVSGTPMQYSVKVQGNTDYPVSVASVESSKDEYTFSDFGLSDQDVTGTVMNTMAPMSTWNNTVFQGKITFPATDWQTSQCENQTVTVGCDGDGSGGVTFRVANGQNFAFFANGMTVTNNASGNTNGWGILDRTAIGYPNTDNDGNQTSVEQDELTYRITAKTLDGGESQKITIEITSAYGTGSYWFKVSGTPMQYSVKVQGNIDYPVSIASVESLKDEYTFSDFGLSDQDATGTVMNTMIPMSTWDNTVFQGKITFPATDWTTGQCENQTVTVGCDGDGSGGVTFRVANGQNLAFFANGMTVVTNASDNTNDWGILDRTAIGYPNADDSGNQTSVEQDELTYRITAKSVDGGENQKITVEITSAYGTGSYWFKVSGQPMQYGIKVQGNSDFPVKIASVDGAESVTYTELTYDEFGLNNQKVINKSTEGRANLSSWDKIAVTGEVTMPATGQEDHYILFGSWGGYMVRSYDRGIILSANSYTGDMIENSNKDGHNYLSIDAGEDITNKKIKLRVTFECVNTDNLKVTVTINETYSGYGIFDNCDIKADTAPNYNILVYSKDDKAIIIGTPEPEPEYKELTFRDFEIDDQSVNGKTVRGDAGITSWDGVAFTGTITLPGVNEEGTHFIRFGTGPSDDTGFSIRSYETGVIIENSNFATEVVTNSENNENPYLFLSAGENTVEKEMTLRVTFDVVDSTNLQVTVTLNGTHSGHVVYSGVDETYFGMLVYANADRTIKIGSTKKTETVNDATYNIENKPYLLTGATVKATNVATNAVFENAGTEVNVAGDYSVVTDTNGIQTSRTVSLYILGDVDLSSSATLSQADVNALKAILDGTEASAAQKKAADLTNDGQITNTDLKLLQDIVNGTTTREVVLDKYYPAAMRYEYLENGSGEAVMPIVGYEGPTAELLSQEIFDGIKAAGINMISSMPFDYLGSRNAVEKALEYAENSQLGMYVRDANTNVLTYSESNSNLVTAQEVASEAEAAAYLGKYNYFDSFLGTFVMDEPVTADYLPYLSTSDTTHKANYAYYEEITKTLNSNANTDGHINVPAAVWFKPGTFSWITGSSGAPYSGVTGQNISATNVAAYENMVKYIAENSNMNYLSYDRYAAMTDENAKECPRYMLNMDIIRAQANNLDIPFWAFAPVGHWTDSGADTDELTEADMFWQINTSLAFGAKGIEYFTVVEPDLYASDDMGIYDSAGNPSQWYDDVQRANTLIAAVDDVLMKSTNKGIIATGGYAATNATSVKVYSSMTSSTTRTIKAAEGYMDGTTPDYTAIKSADGTSRVSSITTSGDYGALAGVFDYQGKVALYVVNYDTASARDITVNFTGISRYSVIGLATDGTVADSTSYGTSCTRNVAAGEAFLLVIEEEDLSTTAQYFEDIAQYRQAGAYTAPKLDGYVFAGWYTDEAAAKKDYDYTVSGALAEEKAAALEDWNEYTLTDLGYPDEDTNGWGLKQDITSFEKLAISGVIKLPSGTEDSNGIWFMNTDAWDQSNRFVIRNAGESIALVKVGFGTVTNNSDNNTNGWVVIPKSAFGLSDSETIVGQNLKIRLTFEQNGSKLRVTLNVYGTSTASAWIDVEVTDLTQLKVCVPNHKAESSTTIQSEDVAQAAYAKFVDESVLSVRGQLGANTTSASSSTSLRFITSTNSLAYQNMGFEIYVPGKGTLTSTTKKVYQTLTGTDNVETYQYTPNMSFDLRSKYFAAVTINNIPNTQFDTEFTAKPFWITMDGTKVYGVPRTLTIRQGIS